MMNYLKPFKIFEINSINKPIKKFPTGPAIHWNYLMQILKESGIDPHENLIKDQRSTCFTDFCSNKCSGVDNIVFPTIRRSADTDYYRDIIHRESIFLLPKTYDSSRDEVDFIQKKDNFFNTIRNTMQSVKSESEMDDLIKKAEKYVHFGPSEYSWVNPALEIVYKKLHQYYKNGKLRIWFPADCDYDHWIGYDYPHKYNIIGKLVNPDGVYYLSDIEKYINDKYGIEDDLFYKFIIDNNYIEGRYWERTWSLRTADLADCHLPENQRGPKNKLQKSGFSNWGMEPTNNILHILNIIELEFGDEICGKFPIYIDYLKQI